MVAFVAAQVASGQSIADLARATGRERARLSRLHALSSAPDFIVDRLDDLPVRGAVALMKAAARNAAAARVYLDGAPLGTLTVAGCEAFLRGVSGSVVGTEDGLASKPKEASVVQAVPRSTGMTEDRREGPMVQPRDEGHLIDVDGKRGRLIEALVQFDGEKQPRMVRFTN